MRRIKPVSDNTDKQNSYREYLRRYNKAMQEGFYLEAILIDYAIIEDRLRSFIYHLGLLNTKDSYKADGTKAKKCLKGIISDYKLNGENDHFNINSITGKIKIIRCTLLWAEQESFNSDDRYLKILRDQYDRYLDVDGLLDTLSEIDDWRDYRNEVIHSLFNKNTYSLNEEISVQAERGMQLARFVDNQVKCLKKGNRIRKSINLSNQ